MGTRSLTVVNDNDGREIAVFYKQYDGYPTGYGTELAKFLAGKLIVNGISGQTAVIAANGMGCLAAQIVAHFKTEIGGYYMHPAGTRDAGEDFVYKVNQKGTSIQLTCLDYDGKILFEGSPDKFINWARTSKL